MAYAMKHVTGLDLAAPLTRTHLMPLVLLPQVLLIAYFLRIIIKLQQRLTSCCSCCYLLPPI
jgi:hypothetical protein